MKKNKSLIVLAILSSISLFACQKNDYSSYVSSSEEEERDFLDERDYSYEYKINQPSSTVSNINELMAICDYHAFYKEASFDVTLSDNYKNATYGGNIKRELNYLYWNTELINGVMGMNATKDGSTLHFTYDFYHNAYETSDSFWELGEDISYHPEINERTDNYNSFATEDQSKPFASVATTQQLWYAAEHGYCIKPIEGSPAESYYSKAKEVLRNIISNDMDVLDKITSIYEYITHTATYDYEATLDDRESPDPNLYPDYYCARNKCYYIEGFFDNNMVVCDGFSKVYTLLCRMEGIETYRALGTSDKNYETRIVAGHAYCFVPYEGYYYLSCPTWGQTSASTTKGAKRYSHHYYMLTGHEDIAPYTSTMWKNLPLYNSVDNTQIIKKVFEKKTYQDTSLTFTNELNKEVADKIINDLDEKGKFINVLVTSERASTSFVNNFKEKGLTIWTLDYGKSIKEYLVTNNGN